MSQKMVIEAKRKKMERFRKKKIYRVVTGESMERDEEDKMISIKWVVTNKETEEHPIARALWHVSSTLETNVVRCLQERQV